MLVDIPNIVFLLDTIHSPGRPHSMASVCLRDYCTIRSYASRDYTQSCTHVIIPILLRVAVVQADVARAGSDAGNRLGCFPITKDARQSAANCQMAFQTSMALRNSVNWEGLDSALSQTSSV